jgi:hypothetical protein
MLHRIIVPRDGRGRKPGSSNNPAVPDMAKLQQYYAQMQQAYASQMGAASLNALAAMNPLYAAQLAQYGMLTGMTGLAQENEREEGEITKKDKEKLKASSTGSQSAQQAAAFQQMYSQMLMNPMYSQYAAMMGGASPFAALASQMAAHQQKGGVVNGDGSGDEDISEKGFAKKNSDGMSHSHGKHSDKQYESGRRKKSVPKHIDKIASKTAVGVKIDKNSTSTQDLPQDLSVKSDQKSPDKNTHIRI